MLRNLRARTAYIPATCALPLPPAPATYLPSRSIAFRLGARVRVCVLLTHVEVATSIEFRPEFIRDSYVFGGSYFGHVFIVMEVRSARSEAY